MLDQPPPAALNLPRQLCDEMLAHLISVLPEEGCGFLAGTAVTISRIYPVENHLHSPTTYEMDPAQQLDAMLDAEAAGLTLLAIYHSHPRGPQRPSPTDVAGAHYPSLAHVIVSSPDTLKPAIRAYTIQNQHVNEIPLNLL